MEDEWWKGTGQTDLNESVPKSVKIPTSTKNTLEGGVNPISQTFSTDVWGDVGRDQSSGLANIGWFLVGIIGMPVVLFSISSALPSPDYNWSSFDSDTYEDIGEIRIDGEVLNLYSLNTQPAFEYAHDDYDYWQVNVDSPNWYGEMSSDEPSYCCLFDENEEYTWFEPAFVYFFSDEFEGTTVLWSFDQDRMLIATEAEVDYLFLSHYGEDYGSEVLPILTCLMWPLVAVGGIVWGFMTKRRAFAYGIISFVGIAIAGAFLLFMLLASMF